MARSKEATKRAKARYTAKYREEHADKVAEYNRKTVKERANRNKARRKLGAKGGDVHHINGNPMDNSKDNLRVVKKHHSGGVKGNKNAKK